MGPLVVLLYNQMDPSLLQIGEGTHRAVGGHYTVTVCRVTEPVVVGYRCSCEIDVDDDVDDDERDWLVEI